MCIGGALLMTAGWFMGYNDVAAVALTVGAALLLVGGLVSLSVRGLVGAVILFGAVLALPLVFNSLLVISGNDPDPGGVFVVTPEPPRGK